MLTFIIFLFSPLVFSLDLCTTFPNLKECLNKNDDQLFCHGHGHIENNKTCVCRPEWQGINCEQPKPDNQKFYSSYNESQFYDWREIHTRRRLSNLYNLNPDSNIEQIDSQFHMEASSINMTNIPNEWISLKKINSSYAMMKGALNVSDIVQGGLQSCFFYAALASLLNYPKGEEYIKNAFSYYNESNSIYVTKWFLFGRFVYVSVDDKVPGNQTTGKPYFAQISKTGAFWAAILEKSWAKIWGNYESILFTSETILWSALTGVLMKQYINVFDIDFIPSLFLKNLLTYPLWTLKSLTTAKKIIPDHSFAVLGIYHVWFGTDLVTLFYLYNPWGTDIDNNKWNDTNELLHTKEFKRHIPFKIEYANDGKFFYSLEDVVLNFERAIGTSPNTKYEPFSVEVPLTDAIEQTIKIKFKVNIFQQSYIYFDLLNDDLFKYQIQPYEIQEVSILPLVLPLSADVKSSNKFTFISVFESFIYKGLFSWFPIPFIYYTLNIRIRKFNYDIIDKMFIVFYTHKDTVQILNKIESKQGCEDNCNNQGKCVNNTCICNENFYGKACSLNNKSINPYVECPSCNNNGYCLSTGKCKCFPGFDSSNNCSRCQDTNLLCSFPIPLCRIKNQICKAKCLYGDCYIPGAQTACEVNKCYGNGFCSRYTGTCFNCRQGYSGQFCQIKNP